MGYFCKVKKRVVVGLSGGVDSSVAALLLKEQGYDVIGMFMRNWHDETVTINNECAWIDDSRDALLVAERLNIPFHVIDLSNQYYERIVKYMFSEYEKGRTPNPDVLCNREIKFDVFLNAALKLGADFVATGHYCRKKITLNDESEIYHLLSGFDNQKDQSYFLCQINQQQLKYALFPIGEMKKNEVRERAEKAGLITAKKKDSQGLCFVGKISLPEFLQQKLNVIKGDIIEIPNSLIEIQKQNRKQTNDDLIKPYFYEKSKGLKKGQHNGAHFFTIGQRKGFSAGGTNKPLFVLHTDTINNIIYAGQGENHPGLYRKGLFIRKEDAHNINGTGLPLNGKFIEIQARIRYRQPLEKATLYYAENGFQLIFENEQRGITPGQFAAWYMNDELIGSGIIAE